MHIKLPLDFYRTIRSQFGTTPVNPITLSFKDPKLEVLFQKRQIERELPVCLLYYSLGLCMYLGFGFLDYMVLDGDAFRMVFTIRLIACSLMFVLMCLLVFPVVQRHFLQLVLSACMLVCGGGIILMTMVTDEPVRHYYYAGMLMVVIFIPFITLFRYAFSAPTSLILILTYLYTSAYVSPVAPDAYVNNIFFLVGMTLISVWANYWSDFYVRSEFIQYYNLEEEKKQSDQLRRKAEAGNYAKSEFLAIVSHELRTPLNAIIGFSDIIRQKIYGSLGNPRYEDYIEDIANSGHQLLNIINNILDLSKAEAGKLTLVEDFVDLQKVAAGVIRMSRQLAKEKNIALRFDSEFRELIIKADPRHIQLMVTNLMSNAIKFTEPGGRVDVSLRIGESGDPCFKVSDNGVGIAPENLVKVVEPFVQIESSMSRQHDGTGLGLPLVKQFAELHGGRLKLESALGKGTDVTVTLPSWRFVHSELAGKEEGATQSQRPGEYQWPDRQQDMKKREAG